jgi:Na+/melibiose symporter-like transporter
MASNPKERKRLTPVWRAVIEVGSIVFLFYSNLLMGEFSRANGRGKTFVFAIEDIFTATNFAIAIISGLMGYVVFEYLRKKI